jgi:hypothetical protein
LIKDIDTATLIPSRSLFYISCALWIGIFHLLIGNIERILSVPSPSHFLYNLHTSNLFHLLIDNIETHTRIRPLCNFYLRYVLLIGLGYLFERKVRESSPFRPVRPLYIMPRLWIHLLYFLIDDIETDIQGPSFCHFAIGYLSLSSWFNRLDRGNWDPGINSFSFSLIDHFHVFNSFLLSPIDEIETDASILPLSSFFYYLRICWLV